jgi:AcrR family transcriptional regulator
MKSPRAYTMNTRADAVATTRDRIVSAAQSLLFEHAYEDITLAGIAKAAGVSHQTVLNHFESKEGVAAAVAAVVGAETVAARDRAVPGDVKQAVHVLVGEYERFGDANARWAATAERLGSLAAFLDEGRASHQAWLARVFADDLPASAAARRRAINALHAATDVYTWKLLRRDLALGRQETERTIVGLVTGVLLAAGDNEEGDNR